MSGGAQSDTRGPDSHTSQANPSGEAWVMRSRWLSMSGRPRVLSESALSWWLECTPTARRLRTRAPGCPSACCDCRLHRCRCRLTSVPKVGSGAFALFSSRPPPRVLFAFQGGGSGFESTPGYPRHHLASRGKALELTGDGLERLDAALSATQDERPLHPR